MAEVDVDALQPLEEEGFETADAPRGIPQRFVGTVIDERFGPNVERDPSSLFYHLTLQTREVVMPEGYTGEVPAEWKETYKVGKGWVSPDTTTLLGPKEGEREKLPNRSVYSILMHRIVGDLRLGDVIRQRGGNSKRLPFLAGMTLVFERTKIKFGTRTEADGSVTVMATEAMLPVSVVEGAQAPAPAPAQTPTTVGTVTPGPGAPPAANGAIPAEMQTAVKAAAAEATSQEHFISLALSRAPGLLSSPARDWILQPGSWEQAKAL